MSVPALRHAPQRVTTTNVLEWNDGERRSVLDDLAAEEPLQIRVGDAITTITMRTPGDDFELAAGFLYSEGIIEGPDHLARVAYGRGPDGCRSGNIVDVALHRGVAVDFTTSQRHFVSASGCGVCGRTSIEALRSRDVPRPSPDFSIASELLTRLPAVLRSTQPVFGRTGGLHAAGLFDANGTLREAREDIGRHNAVDKVIGASLLRGNGELPWSERVLVVS